MLMHATESDLRIPVQVDDFADICDTVENICAKFPAKYWRDLEDRPVRERFPEAFVAALSEAGCQFYCFRGASGPSHLRRQRHVSDAFPV